VNFGGRPGRRGSSSPSDGGRVSSCLA
jgi:hypothetical protein